MEYEYMSYNICGGGSREEGLGEMMFLWWVEIVPQYLSSESI